MEDTSFDGITDITGSPLLLVHFLFVVLMLFLTTFGLSVGRHLMPTKCRSLKFFYEEIENKLFFEEYEDPN